MQIKKFNYSCSIPFLVDTEYGTTTFIRGIVLAEQFPSHNKTVVLSYIMTEHMHIYDTKDPKEETDEDSY